MLEKDARTKNEVASGQPTCEIDLEVTEETATDCWMGDDGNLQNQKETSLEEKPEEDHDHDSLAFEAAQVVQQILFPTLLYSQEIIQHLR